MAAAEHPCPVCNAEVGELCRTGGGPDADGHPTFEHYPEGEEHARRKALSA